jgi:hypothetical protein
MGLLEVAAISRKTLNTEKDLTEASLGKVRAGKQGVNQTLLNHLLASS